MNYNINPKILIIACGGIILVAIVTIKTIGLISYCSAKKLSEKGKCPTLRCKESGKAKEDNDFDDLDLLDESDC